MLWHKHTTHISLLRIRLTMRTLLPLLFYTRVYIPNYTMVYMETTTIKLTKKLVRILNKMKVHKRQSYEEVILKLVELNKVMDDDKKVR